MRNKIKKIITSSGKVQYFYGDGIWFGRIAKDAAELGLATGKYKMWEIKYPALRLVK